MSKKIKGLLRNFVIFIVLLSLGHLAEYLPDALWCLAIQIGLYGAALVVGIRLLLTTNQDINNHHNPSDET